MRQPKQHFTRGRKLLLKWRETSTLSQRNLAKLLRISEPHLSQLLAALKRPSLELSTRIEKLTGIPPRAWAESSVADTDEDESVAVYSRRQTRS